MFSRENKINIPSLYKVLTNQLVGSDRKIQGSSSTIAFDPSMTMSKAPKFLANNKNMRITMNQNLAHSMSQLLINNLQEQ